MDLTIGNVIYVYVLIKKIFVIVKYLKITNQNVKGYIGLIKARQEASKKYYGDFAND